ncbi:MAG: Uma2 family endonuclease, partial [Candidatus Eremiobacterota bacterium]
KFLEGAPTLIVEILSPGTVRHDRVVKMNRYARSGVPYYWLADPVETTLELYRLDGSTYRLEASLGPADRHRPLAFPEVELSMDELFAPLPED